MRQRNALPAFNFGGNRNKNNTANSFTSRLFSSKQIARGFDHIKSSQMGTTCSWCPCWKKVPPVSPSPSKSTTIVEPTSRTTSAKSSGSQTSTSLPFSKSGLSKGNPLNLIRGFEKEPLVSLEEALEPFDGTIDHLSHYIKEAKTNCHYPSENGLTRDESAAIYIYTRRWAKGCLYDRLQESWESNTPSQMKPWFKFLKLFKSAYDKLPNADEEIWQGKLFDPRLKKELDSESSPLYAAMDIFPSWKSLIGKHLNSIGTGQKMIFGFQGVGAKLPGPHAADVDKQYAAVVFPGMKLAVASVEQSNDGQSLIFHFTGQMRKFECCIFCFCRLIDTSDILFMLSKGQASEGITRNRQTLCLSKQDS